jgi:hypothetical protein
MKGIVYQIVCNVVVDERYVGSTTLSLNERIGQHKTYKRHKRRCASAQIIERGNYTFSVLEEVDVDYFAELRKVEQEWLDKLVCINKQRAYVENRLEAVRQAQTKYRNANREKLNAKSVCECGGHYTQKHQAKHLKTIKHQSFIQAQTEHQ